MMKVCDVKNIFSCRVVKYSMVGLMTNLSCYMLYLFLTWHWLDPKSTVSLIYPIAAVLGFYTHGKFSFAYVGNRLVSVLRYIVAHGIGYVINIGLLYIFVNLFGYPHQFVQLFATVGVAGVLFLLFQYFVFPAKV